MGRLAVSIGFSIAVWSGVILAITICAEQLMIVRRPAATIGGASGIIGAICIAPNAAHLSVKQRVLSMVLCAIGTFPIWFLQIGLYESLRLSAIERVTVFGATTGSSCGILSFLIIRLIERYSQTPDAPDVIEEDKVEPVSIDD